MHCQISIYLLVINFIFQFERALNNNQINESYKPLLNDFNPTTFKQMTDYLLISLTQKYSFNQWPTATINDWS